MPSSRARAARPRERVLEFPGVAQVERHADEVAQDRGVAGVEAPGLRALPGGLEQAAHGEDESEVDEACDALRPPGEELRVDLELLGERGARRAHQLGLLLEGPARVQSVA